MFDVAYKPRDNQNEVLINIPEKQPETTNDDHGRKKLFGLFCVSLVGFGIALIGLNQILQPNTNTNTYPMDLTGRNISIPGNYSDLVGIICESRTGYNGNITNIIDTETAACLEWLIQAIFKKV